MSTPLIQPPVPTPAAGPVMETCFYCTCFEDELSAACDACNFCHPCRMCSKDHPGPKNRACPAPRIRLQKTGPIWYAECPLTLTGECNPRFGCEGSKHLAKLHGWAMRHVAKHRAEVR